MLIKSSNNLKLVLAFVVCCLWWKADSHAQQQQQRDASAQSFAVTRAQPGVWMELWTTDMGYIVTPLGLMQWTFTPGQYVSGRLKPDNTICIDWQKNGKPKTTCYRIQSQAVNTHSK
jgi:hypothetical protein